MGSEEAKGLLSACTWVVDVTDRKTHGPTDAVVPGDLASVVLCDSKVNNISIKYTLLKPGCQHPDPSHLTFLQQLIN